jgi:acylphosphatase
MNKRLEATVYGYVHGVSFRYYTHREATRLNVTGWVANQNDGTVRVVAEGPQAALQDLARFLLTGSPKARVEHVKADWLEAINEFSNFTVRHL